MDFSSHEALKPWRKHSIHENGSPKPIFFHASSEQGSSMRSRISLDSFQIFATAARSATFLEAARRLNVTPSAVSHQIRSLDRLLGTELFERHGRSVRLNTAGTGLLKSVEPALRTIEESCRATLRS